MCFVVFFSAILFYYPNLLGHPDNYIPADPMVTPAHIVPEWYFLPFYAILRSIPDKLGGVVAMGGAIVILLFLPFINTSKVRSSTFRPIFRICFWFLFADFLLLGWIGQEVVEEPFVMIGQLGTLFYFLYFLVFIPLVGIVENSLIRTNV
jgi:ubiquinol-cytochrome c reductase cytochrome b subunit